MDKVILNNINIDTVILENIDINKKGQYLLESFGSKY